jgi:FHS family glucose/mannose:H+ symporter-like MFS transporter
MMPLRKSFAVSLGAFASIGMVGVFHTVLGTALAEMRPFFGMGLVQAGLFGSAYWAGFTLAVLAAGALSDRYPRSSVLTGSCMLTAFGGLTLGLNSVFWINLAIIICIGGGTGAIVSSSSALLMEMHSGREGMILNLHHFFYAVGAVGAPIIMGYILSTGWKWQGIYRVAGIVSLALTVLLVLSSTRTSKVRIRVSLRTIGKTARDSKMVLLIGLTVLGIGAQNGVIYWIVTFLHDNRSLPVLRASFGLALLSAGMAAGRLILAWLTTRTHYLKVLVILFVCINISLLLLLFFSGETMDLVLCFLAGCGFSGLFPLILAMGGTVFAGRSGTAVGIITAAAGLGSTLMPWMMSKAAEASSLDWGMGLGNVSAFLGLCLACAAGRTAAFKTVGPGEADEYRVLH